MRNRADSTPVLPRETPVDDEAVALAGFLRQDAERIARLAAREATSGLPIGGTGMRRRLRTTFGQQLLEQARHLEAYGADEGPRLYGESQRRYAASHLAQGVALADTIE